MPRSLANGSEQERPHSLFGPLRPASYLISWCDFAALSANPKGPAAFAELSAISLEIKGVQRKIKEDGMLNRWDPTGCYGRGWQESIPRVAHIPDHSLGSSKVDCSNFSSVRTPFVQVFSSKFVPTSWGNGDITSTTSLGDACVSLSPNPHPRHAERVYRDLRLSCSWGGHRGLASGVSQADTPRVIPGERRVSGGE